MWVSEDVVGSMILRKGNDYIWLYKNHACRTDVGNSFFMYTLNLTLYGAI